MSLWLPRLALLLAVPAWAQAPAASAPASDLKAIARMIEQGQLVPAERRLRAMLVARDDPGARDLLGVVLSEQGRFDEAERQFRQVLAASPAQFDALQHLARLYLTQKREAEAVVELRKAARQGPLERDLALKLAGVELAAGNPASAELLLRSAAERYESAQALLQLARLQSSRRDASGALESLRRAREIAPNSEDVLGSYAQVCLGSRAPVPAILALEPLTRMHPAVAQYHYLLGVAFMQAGDVASAVEALQKAERLEPDRALTLVALGLALNNRKRYAEARPYLMRSLELEPDDVEAVAALAESEDGLGDLAQAEALARRALERVATHATANLVMGIILMRRERYAEARDAFEKAVAADPGSSRAHYQLSLAYARLGDEPSSQKHVELYKKMLKDAEERVEQLRNQTGVVGGGMSP